MGKIYFLALLLIVQAVAFQTLHDEQKTNENTEVHMTSMSDKNLDKKDQSNKLKGEVGCMRQYQSPYAYPTKCTSQTPLPIKIYTSFKMKKDGIYWYGEDDFNFYLQDGYQAYYFFEPNACLYSTTPAGKKKVGTVIEIWATCFRAPKTLTYGDHIYIEGFVHDNHKSDWLGYGIPLPGYSTEQFIESLPKRQRRSLPKKSKSNQLILDEQTTQSQ